MVTSATIHVPHALPPRPSMVDREPEVTAALASAAACARAERSCRLWFSGEAGVGKTALAITVAYRLADQGTDGELYADLRGSSPREAVDAFEVLGMFLRQLGVARDDLPETTASRSALFRTLTDSKRVILVLDDAGGPAHIRDLLPNSTKAVVIATSATDHHGVTGEDFEPFRTERLEPAYSAELLTRQVGADPVSSPARRAHRRPGIGPQPAPARQPDLAAVHPDQLRAAFTRTRHRASGPHPVPASGPDHPIAYRRPYARRHPGRDRRDPR